jgi:acyl carrier protein
MKVEGMQVADSEAQMVEATLRALLAEVLGLSAKRVAAFDQATALFGALPEFDSMAVAALLTGIEERFAILIEDDDAEAEDFMSYGRLLSFVKRMTFR